MQKTGVRILLLLSVYIETQLHSHTDRTKHVCNGWILSPCTHWKTLLTQALIRSAWERTSIIAHNSQFDVTNNKQTEKCRKYSNKTLNSINFWNELIPTKCCKNTEWIYSADKKEGNLLDFALNFDEWLSQS